MIKFESLDNYENVWLTSDSHYAHKNIVKGTSTWTDTIRCRNFDTVEEMNNAIEEGLKVVGENDVLLHCGDIAFGGQENIIKYVSLCRGDIILTYGNHDHNVRKKDDLQAYFKSAEDIQYIQFKGQNIVMCHYPLIVWHQHHKGAVNAFGHVHGNLEGRGRSHDVGVDVAFNMFGEYRPFSFDEFVEIANSKDINFETHHNTNTN